MASTHHTLLNEAAAGPTLIVGLGKTGLSCARFLAARGANLSVVDSRAEPPGLAELRRELPQVPVRVGGFATEVFKAAKRLVVSPGVAVQEPEIVAARVRGAEVVGDIEVFARYASAPVVAITGANGKSTVTTLVGEMAARAGRRVQVGGNLGTPALDLLAGEVPDFYVLELSSFQLETTNTLNAAAAVVLNITPDHMDRYADVQAYAAAKQRVYHGTGVMVINVDDPRVAAMAEAGRRVVSFSLGAPAAQGYGLLPRDGKTWLAKGCEALMPVDEIRIPGRHNQANALAALALGEVMGLPMAVMLEELRVFPGLLHRTQFVAEIGGVRWYNDSKGTNVGATAAAVEGMQNTLVLILGGQGKGADFTALRAVVRGKVRAAVLIGEDAPKIFTALEGVTPMVYATDMGDAVRHAQRLAQPGDAVLLSPACASFDMFKGYDHRGQVFAQAVQELAA